MLDDKLDSRCRCQWRVRGRRGDFQLQRAQTRAVPRPGTRGRLLPSVLRPGLCLVNLKPAPQAELEFTVPLALPVETLPAPTVGPFVPRIPGSIPR